MTEELLAYKRMPLWTAETMPEAVKRKHNTKEGTWGKITVLKGRLKFVEMSEEGEELAEHIFEAGQDNPFAQPQAWHRVEALTDDLEWYLEFYCRPEEQSSSLRGFGGYANSPARAGLRSRLWSRPQCSLSGQAGL